MDTEEKDEQREMEMEGLEHRTVSVNGINMHVAIQGPDGGPVVLFLHGFPELWYSWRHQISTLAALGYRAVAPDLRGFGDTDAPLQICSYTCFHIVGDLVALLAALAADQKRVFVVGHDWGAIIAWYFCLFRPDKVRALVNLSVPFRLIDSSRNPLEILRASYGDDFYICRFQEPGDIEAEFAEVGIERVVKNFLTSFTPQPIHLPKDKGFWRWPIALPSWLSQKDVEYYTTKFEKTGFTGGLNYYRNFQRNYELLAPWVGCKVQVPVKFIIGNQDLVYHMPGTKEYIHGEGFKESVPLLEEVVVMDGVGHFLNQEKPEEINQHIYDFIKKF